MRNSVLVLRGGKVESCHVIHAAVVDSKHNLIAKVGNPNLKTFIRSSAKPFQTLALFRAGVIDHFDFDDKEIAIISASHNGEVFHLDVLNSIIQKTGLKESQLLCGYHSPFHAASAKRILNENKTKSLLQNNCSGKHLGMLSACLVKGYSMDSYIDPEHPHQIAIREIISEYSEIPYENSEFGIDGCGVPAFCLPLKTMALMFAKFASGKDSDVVRIREAMAKYPELVAGTRRFDTQFMQTTQGRAVSKVGGEAVECFSFFDSHGMGIALKCEDGQLRGVEPAAIDILLQMNLISESEAMTMDNYWRPVLKNHVGVETGRILTDIQVEFLNQ